MPHLSRTWLLLPLAAVASLILASLACTQSGIWPSPPTPTQPMIMCTAPACQANESYFCPGQCPGGCGTTCATHTPGPTPTSQCPAGEFFMAEGNTFRCMTPTPWVTDTPEILETPTEVSCQPGELYLPAEGVFKCVTPTPWVPTPQIQCTPPACQPGEVFYCAGQCPGGCGTTCATPTPPAPAASGAPCAIVTRTPPPGAPTYAANSPDLPSRSVDPHVEVCASARTLKVGELTTLMGQAIDIGLPYFYVMVRPAGTGDFQQWVAVTYNNELKDQTDASAALELVSVRGESKQLTLVLRARAAGAVDVVINATGEVHYGYPGPAMWAGGGSDPFTLTVEK